MSENNPTNEDLTKTSAVSTTFTVEVLKLTKEGQQQHGLRHMDYQRYKSYCTRRLRRLRKTLHFVCGNQKRYQKREINMDEINDSKFLLIPLFQAERAWAFAMQLKQESNTEPRKKFHLVSRLRKAAKFSSELEKLSQSPKCDARTKLEAQGYNSLINGQFYFENQKWKESLNHFNIAKKIYEKLSAALNGDDAQPFYSLKVEEIVPNIRYCNYNLGDETAKKDLMDMKFKSAGSELAEKIEELILQTKEKQVVTFSEVVWRNKITLQIKNEKVKSFLLNVQEYEKQIQASANFDEKILFYENILKESVDSIQLVRDELKLDPHFQLIQRGQILPPDEKPSNSLLLFSYLTWTRINKTIERNLLMVESFKNQMNKLNNNSSNNNNKKNDNEQVKNARPQDIVRLYDIIIQNYKDMNNLPGLSNDKYFNAESEFYINYYKAFRCYYIYLFYLFNKKYQEAVGFCFKVENYLRLVEKSMNEIGKNTNNAIDKNVLSSFKNDLTKLSNELNQSKYKLQTAAILQDSATESSSSLTDDVLSKDKLTKIPLIDRLDVYFEDENLVNGNPNIVKLPLNYEPIPCKPLFFDLALNHVELPSFDDKIDVKKQAQNQQQQGVKGFFKGLLGFS